MSDRAEFESTVRATWGDNYSFMRDVDGHYCDDVLDGMWWAWQAARAQGDAEPVALLRREIGESTWFDHAPVKPNTREAEWLKASPILDYCEVYTQPQPAQPEVDWIQCSERQVDAINHSLDVLSKHGDAFTSVGAMSVLEKMIDPQPPQEGSGDE